MTFTEHFPIQFEPQANPAAVVSGLNFRFTVLTSRLLRLEYSPSGDFEDRPSQAFWYRQQPVPQYEVTEQNGRLSLYTEHLQLTYSNSPAGFSGVTLQITLKQNHATWVYGQKDPHNLRGTTRTLDEADGAITLEDGLISRSGWAVYDDSASLVFTEQGWLANRNAPDGYRDLYFFGYGNDYYGCLREFSRIAGAAPMLPRWALGNWWSRYWAYSDEELLGLMDEFKAKKVPLSVCIVDMDWHITDTGNTSSGWTGYTWNRELFPYPRQFVAELHKRGLKTALNLHPAAGIHPHEEQYAAMARHMAVDPELQEPIPFSLADPHFAQGYFELLHHPQEALGIDFWWIDWQQGTVSGLPDLDPLWWLNHLHFYDLGRDRSDGTASRRPFIFSRWGGLGNHRYPIGFSGDTVVTWDSLQFQPYFTASAANVNYGWWSHDIGGHMGGIEDPELYARWIQYGVFSPILRMHCTNNPFHERRPWGYDAEVERVASNALRLRHALIPYLYTMAWRNHIEHVPLIRPMYYDHPGEEPAYHCPDQYGFGSELLAAPFITPADPDTRLSRQVVWLPKGEWFHFFDGTRYDGEQWYPIYGALDEIPVFAKAGAIVPMIPEATWNENTNPETIELHLFPGADNQFSLYEDDDHEAYSITPIDASWSDRKWIVTVGETVGNTAHLPALRTYVMKFRKVKSGMTVSVTLGGEALNVTTDYDSQSGILTVTNPPLSIGDLLTVILTAEGKTEQAGESPLLNTCQSLVKAFRMESWRKHSLFNNLPAMVENPKGLASYSLSLTSSQQRALFETLTGAGFHLRPARRQSDKEVLFWNNAERDQVRFKLVAADLNKQPTFKYEPLPRFGVLTIGERALSLHIGIQPAEGRVSVSAWFDTLAGRIHSERVTDSVVVQFEIGDVQVYLAPENDETKVAAGTHEKPDVSIKAETDDWLALLNGDTSPEELFLGGKLNIVGDLNLVMLLADAIQLTPQSKYLADRFQLEVNYLDILTLDLSPVG